jgi:predicted LPLAT superfamily acyltransferase
MALSLSHAPSPRNPGPNWGYQFLTRADALLPAALFRRLLALGAWVAVGAMRRQRDCSRQYLTCVLGRAPRLGEIWRHFFAFSEALVRKLRAADGRPFRCVFDPSASDFAGLLAAGRSALLGTFHVGDADLLGFMLGHFRRRVHMVRLQVDNSPETRRLARQFDNAVRFIWVNDRERLLFALKEAIQEDGLVAMQCDRPDFSAKLEPFAFLGERRLFPFTVYHLAFIFQRPVVLCLGIPQGESGAVVLSSSVFEAGTDRDAHFHRARTHFQAFLGLVERELQRNPYLWFNFTPLNAAVAA